MGEGGGEVGYVEEKGIVCFWKGGGRVVKLLSEGWRER